jgi:uncharacterized protein
MSFEWDERKRRSNLKAHSVDFVDVLPLFDGPFFEYPDDREDYGELRMVAIGAVDGRVYAIVYTWRGGSRRLISARKSDKHEREAYYASLRRAGAQDEG